MITSVKARFFFSLFLASTSFTYAQIAVGTISPDPSAKLEISSSDKGFLPPRVALTANNLAGPISSPATSLLVYNTATAGSGSAKVTPGYYYYDGSKWQRFESQPQSMQTIACKVEASGSLSSVFAGLGCMHAPGSGQYLITLPIGVPTYIYPTATLFGSGPGYVSVELASGTVVVNTFDYTGTLTDKAFNLICIYSTY